MGLLVKGEWKDQWYDTDANDGEFIRSKAQFRNWVTEDGSPGPNGRGGFKAESGRYHLYVSLACPWAHRTLIFRKLKQLDDHISISVVHPDMLEHGWSFDGNPSAAYGVEIKDHLFNSQHYYEIYTRADNRYSGRVTVPVLWDKQNNTIVSNESSEIIRMFNSAFNNVTDNQQDFYPPHLRDLIDRFNERIYDTVNNGVYQCGFATTQRAYEEAYNKLFDSLDWLEAHFTTSRYLCGNDLTEADWRLFTTLLRFDPVYYGHFKCNKQRISDYPNLSAYMRELFQLPGISDTFNLEHCKRHYYYSHKTINPTQVVPVGPKIDYFAPFDRQQS